MLAFEVFSVRLLLGGKETQESLQYFEENIPHLVAKHVCIYFVNTFTFWCKAISLLIVLFLCNYNLCFNKCYECVYI